MAKLYQSDVGAKALARPDLLEAVVTHKRLFFSSAWANDGTAVRGSLRLVPPEERRSVLETDYRAMRETMIFGETVVRRVARGARRSRSGCSTKTSVERGSRGRLLDRRSLGPCKLVGEHGANTRDSKTLGDVIREARIPKGSLRAYAKKLDITPSYLSDIENDRRVPAEDVLRKIAELLGLDFDDLMARAGRLGEETDRYMRRHPTAGVLFRQLSESNTPEDDLAKLMKRAAELAKKREEQ